jgi:hypothetical protein
MEMFLILSLSLSFIRGRRELLEILDIKVSVVLCNLRRLDASLSFITGPIGLDGPKGEAVSTTHSTHTVERIMMMTFNYIGTIG